MPIPPECDSSSSNASLRSLSSTKREACSIAESSVASVNDFGGFVSPFLIVAVPSGDKTTSRPGSRFEGMTLHYSLFLNCATLLLFRFPFTRLHSYATRKMPESSSHDSTVNRENILFKKSKTPRLVPVTRIAWWMEGTEPPRNGACARWVFKEKAAAGNFQPRAVHQSGAPGGTRTHTVQILRLSPLPIGIQGPSHNLTMLTQKMICKVLEQSAFRAILDTLIATCRSLQIGNISTSSENNGKASIQMDGSPPVR